MRASLILWALVWFVGAPAFAKDVSIYVTSNGWHSGIVIARVDLPVGAIPETADFPNARYFEFGWGDAAYYPDRDAGLGKGAAALFGNSPAVVHLVGLWGSPARVFPDAEVIELSLTPEGFDALIGYLDRSFDRGDTDRVVASAPGLYDISLFYPATGDFHASNTCNHWTARGLQTAGFDIDPTGKRRASRLMAAVREIAGKQD